MTYKTDLAQQYFPKLEPQRALRQLKNIIKAHPSLMSELTASGYEPRKQCHYFTPIEVEIIVRHLGKP